MGLTFSLFLTRIQASLEILVKIISSSRKMFILALITNNRVMAATHLLDNDVNKIFQPPEEIDTCVLKSKENIYCRS